MANLDKVLMIYTDWRNNPGDKDKFGGVGYYRVIQPGNACKIHNTSDFVRELTGKEECDSEELCTKMFEKYDVVYTKPMNDKNMIAWMITAAKHFKKKYILDWDDDFLNVDPLSYAYYQIVRGEVDPSIWMAQLQNCDHLVVSTEQLKNVYRQYQPEVTVIPNSFDFSLYNTPKKIEDGKIRILYAGGVSHERDLRLIENVLRRIDKKYGDKVEIFLVGHDSDCMKGIKYTWSMGTNIFLSYGKLIEGINPDIGLAPLDSTKFNDGKSCIKWYEMTAVGAAVVASNFGPYKRAINNGIDGVLCNTEDEWVGKISELIENKTLRNKLVKRARKEIEENHSIEKNKDKWIEFFKQL